MVQCPDRGTSSAQGDQADAQADANGLRESKDANGDLAAGYGTRSRNRGGQSRPNYAEDKDIENDSYEFYHDSKDTDAKRPSRQSAAAASGEVTTANASSRKSTAATTTDDSKVATAANGVKESAASNAGTNPTSGATQPSRKRKATAAAASSANGGSTSVATRRGAHATQPAGTAWPETNLLTFENCKARPQNGRMVADDGTVLEANDHVYLVCEPPGEPYYLGRIMEFLHSKNDSTRPVDALRINWYYRPKDIGRKVTDTRLVFATMHSDISPLTALRGKCQIRHRAEIENMDEYRKTPDSFWFEKLYDRYIQKNYDLIPTPKIVNVPDKVKKVLDDRWKYVLVEQGRGKELTSAVKLCKRCSSYCASNDSVDCAVCHNTYHMNCVKPPLLKKPSRGFAWSCAACSRAQERKLEARHTPNVADPNADLEDEEMLDEEDDDLHACDTARNSPDGDENHHQGTAEQIYQASLWPYRYLGMHCKPEDALDYDDRIYPRASTRIGPRHQAVVGPWTGEPAPLAQHDVRKGRKDIKANRDANSGPDSDKNRKGKGKKAAQDHSMICYERGGDSNELESTSTSTLIWQPPPTGQPTPEEVVEYMDKARQLTDKLKLPKHSTNLQDVALESYCRNDYDAEKALKSVQKADREDFKEPTLTPAELKKFEEGIEKFGSELQAVKRHVKSLKAGVIVRFYYTWKKTPRGRLIWDNHGTRKSKKEVKKAEAEANKLADDVADPDDDSAFDSNKAAERKRSFICQFCSTTTSRQWRRAPSAIPGLVTETGAKATSKDKGPQYVQALCRRCAELWRRYAIRWEDMEEVAKKVAQSGGKAWKRKQDEELLKELQAAREHGMATPDERPATPLATAPTTNSQEPPRKKLKGAPEKDGEPAVSDGGSVSASGPPKKKDKTVEAPSLPEMPKPRILPCAVCDKKDPPDSAPGNQHVTCRECRLTVHRHCYGIMEQRGPGKWLCDMCTNDKNPQVSIQYKCVLCPIEHTEHEFVEQPKLTHHKKKMSDKDREREKLEVQQARKAAEQYRKRQEELNRPVNPREPLKRTADNNWVHVTCAVWTPEVKFGNARALEPSEGIPSIPRARYDEVCQACHKTDGATISCHQCRMNFHVECARQHGHVLGFDITPVKSSRRDQTDTVSINGVDGVLAARLWCQNHLPTKTAVFEMNDQVGDLNVLQVYVQTYKQADLTLTGTVRKANLMAAAAKLSGLPSQTPVRRQSTVTGGNGIVKPDIIADTQSAAGQPGQWVCISCGIDVSPKWWPIDHSQERELTNGHYGAIGSEARKFVDQRKFQCHRCRKTNRTPKPHAIPTPASVATPAVAQIQHSEPIEAPIPASSPRHGPRPMHADQRDPRPASRGWGPHPHPSGPPASATPAAHLPNVPGPEYPSPHALPPRPGYATGPYAGPPVPPVHGDWLPPRPSSQHGSPPQHMNGGPPALHSGPPPLAGLGSLRPPPMSGLLPPGPISGSPHHGIGAQPYLNGMPPSPRRHSSGPAPPSPYIGPYATGTSHLPPPPRTGPHGIINGPPPPPPPPPPMRNDGYPSGLASQRPPGGVPLQRAAYPAPHASPPGSRSGLPPPLEPSGRAGSIPPRAPEQRPASGASASPSLRNLLS
ncbi:hypothetical protein NLU13_3197 [Sarocladium strictum]|uniref:Uncharacterized protein n=1 Tax=Sarocladium strictum TaxID=5046 RepID=A0AA39GP98_SARSR|nr:hypothetical protein NLU13_3197 [Sarocladium strictum]